MTRRRFAKKLSLAAGLATTIAGDLQVAAQFNGSDKAKWRAGIIGHTGQGNYGHGLDLVFNDRPNVEVVAVADPDAAGREGAAKNSRALRQYADYREMLEKEKPHLVSVAPRATAEHHAMAMSAFSIGAHVYMEKPFATTLAEADELIAFADKKRLRIAVAHQMRLAPGILNLKQSIGEGLIGELVQIRAYGKQDNRAGGEDLLVLGTHLFDLIRFFAGNPVWCSARVLQSGREITRQNARAASEEIGPVAGDEIEAQFAFENGIQVSFTSRAKLRQNVGHWGLELIGSKTTARILADVDPRILVIKSGPWTDAGRTDEWQPLENDPGLRARVEDRGFVAANRRVVDDWLEAIEQTREPVCSGFAAMKALEMVMSVYQAALTRGRVEFPLAPRQHPLSAE
jgi:predicted dehydrogenase